MADVRERLEAALAEHYAIDRQLGAGGMATVYVARDLKHDRHVAVKVLRPELAAVLGIDRFLSEIRVTAHLQHPHILPLFDSGQAGGLIYYVMPYVEGESLRQRLEREQQLPIDEAVSLTANVAEALDYAHRHGVVHRDIKPENVLFQDGQAVVADFGIALAVSAAAGSRLTETGLSVGSPCGRSRPGRSPGSRPASRSGSRCVRDPSAAHDRWLASRWRCRRAPRWPSSRRAQPWRCPRTARGSCTSAPPPPVTSCSAANSRSSSPWPWPARKTPAVRSSRRTDAGWRTSRTASFTSRL